VNTTLKIPVLKTDRLILRLWREEDFNALAEFLGDEQQAQFLGGAQKPWDVWRAMASTIGHWHFRGYGFFALEEKNTGKACGWCGPWFPEGWPEPEIGWSIFEPYQAQGYATEAAKCAMNFAYNELSFTTAISLIDADNEASRSVARKLGATLESKDVLVNGFTSDVWRHLPPEQFREHVA